jgi:hypothetical protein
MDTKIKYKTILVMAILLLGYKNISATNYAIIISIEDYIYQPSLAYANSDAALMGLTIYAGKLGNILDEHIYHLFNEKATAENIELILSHLSEIMSKEDQLFFYYSGHGYFGGLYTYDLYAIKMLSYKKLRQHLQTINCKNKIIILDTCFSGSLYLNTMDDVNTLESYFDNETKYKNRNRTSNTIVLMSSRLDESSYETVQLGHGLFTYYLCKGLNGAGDLNLDKNISIEELYYYTRDNVYLYKKGKSSYVQCPTLMGNYQNNYIISKTK